MANTSVIRANVGLTNAGLHRIGCFDCLWVGITREPRCPLCGAPLVEPKEKKQRKKKMDDNEAKISITLPQALAFKTALDEMVSGVTATLEQMEIGPTPPVRDVQAAATLEEIRHAIRDVRDELQKLIAAQT